MRGGWNKQGNTREEVIGSIVAMEAREVGRDLARRHNAPQGSPPLGISPRIEGRCSDIFGQRVTAIVTMTCRNTQVIDEAI